MSKAAAAKHLLAVIRRYLDRMPWFVAEKIQAAIKEYEEAT